MGNQHQLERYSAIASALPFTFGRVFFVSPDAETYAGELDDKFPADIFGQVRSFPTLEAVLNATDGTGVVSGRNDVVILDGNGVHSLAAMITLSKNRVHVVGLDWLMGDRREEGQSSKVRIASGANAYVLTNTGVRNSFKGIKFIQASTNAAALGVLAEAGEASLYENCSAIFEVADNLGSTSAREVAWNGDTSVARKCNFGTSTLLTTVARTVLSFERITGSASGDAAKNCSIEDCTFQIQSTSASATLIKVANANAVKFNNRIISPRLEAAINGTNVAITLSNAIASVSGLTEGNIIVSNPVTNCTKVCAGVTDNIKVVGAAPSATTGIGATPA